jgi:hypothetical protein
MLAQKLQQAAAQRKISVEVANSFALNSPKKVRVVRNKLGIAGVLVLCLVVVILLVLR